MACGQGKSNIKNNLQESPVLKDQRKRPQGIKKQQAVRRSSRLQAIRQSHKQSLSKSNYIQEVRTSPFPPTINIPGTKYPQVLRNPYVLSRKRNRAREEQEAEHRSPIQDQPPPKRLRTKSSSFTAEKDLHSEAATDISEDGSDPLQYWIQTGKWRKEYFEQNSQVREDFEKGKSSDEFERKDWLQKPYINAPFRLMHLHHFLARKKSSSSLRRKKSQSSLQTSSDQLSRESRSSQYNNIEYEIRLEQKGSYMRKSTLGILDTSRDLCRILLEEEQSIPQDTLFRDDLFEETCESVQGRNEAMIVRDISPLICPSAQILRIHGAKHLKHLYESIGEGWNSMAAFEGTLPQPDYSVGFGRSAFTQEQLNKLKPFVGEPGFKVVTYFMATTRMYFPFLTCEVKCGAAALDIADRQNAQSMSVAVRALVVLFRWVKREKELNREILAFSISHDHRSVRVYGHYAIIEDDKTTFYRHPIHMSDFTAPGGRERWTAYKFVKNVYDHHSLKLHKTICSAIDDLPADISFDLSQISSFSTP